MELTRLLTHLDLHKYQVLECMVVYNMSKYAEMCEEPCLRKCYHIWTDSPLKSHVNVHFTGAPGFYM